MLFKHLLVEYELYIQILAVAFFFVGTLFLAFSNESYNPKYKKTHYMPTKVILWKFRLGISLNFLGFLAIVLINSVKLL
jgi:hypothetical protein